MKKFFLVFLALITISAGAFAMGGGFYYAGNETDSSKMFGGGKRSGKLLKYGRWEARSKIMGGQSVVSCFILINYKKIDETIDFWHEVDIEINGQNRNKIETVVHEGKLAYMSPERGYLYNHHPYDFNVDDEYHTWAIEWTPNRVILELDGVPYRWANLDGDELTHDFKYTMEGYDWDNAPEFGEKETEEVLGDDEPTIKVEDGDTARDKDGNPIIEREEVSWVKLLQDARMAFGNDCWAGCNKQWCGEWEESNCGNYMVWSWFKYYEYTEAGDGDDGSCFKLVCSENFDDPDIMKYDSTDDFYEPSELSIYGDVAIKDGKLVAYFTDDSLSVIGDTVRIATGCSASDRDAKIPEDAEDEEGEIPDNKNLRGVLDHPPELASFKEMYAAKKLGVNLLKCVNSKIEFHLQKASHVNLSLYNMNGRLVQELVNGDMTANVHKITLDKSVLAAGTYTLVLQTPYARNSQAMVTVSSAK